MSKSILLIGHGSRDSDAIAEFNCFAQDFQDMLGTQQVRTAFLEYAPPAILEAIQASVETGVSEITAIPLFLLPGRHIRRDVPAELAKARRLYPQVRFFYTSHLGLDDAMLELLARRIEAIEGEDGARLREESILLLVGRGASDPEANGDLAKVARLLYEKQGWASVELCFVGTARPNLQAGLQRCRMLGTRRIVIVPYLLFTGVLEKRIERIVDAERQLHPEIEYLCAPYLGSHPVLMGLLKQRIEEAWPAGSNDRCAHCIYKNW